MTAAVTGAHERDREAETATAAQVFRDAWSALETELGRSNLRFPKEIIWLNGAPGSGKGTNTPFIMRERSITAPPVVVSSLLNSAEFERIKAQGNLISDTDVVRILFRTLLDQIYRDGVVVDGFPRTRVQADCLRHLHRAMLELRKEFTGTTLAPMFPTPVFRVAVLWVGERESLERQLKRGRQIIANNLKVRESGEGTLLEERPTDLNEEAARKRYRIFQEKTLSALQGLREDFHYHLVDAQSGLAEVEANIIREFQYQSTLELESETLDALNHLPLVGDLIQHSRQQLVRRLDAYQRDRPTLLKQAIWVIEQEILPTVVAQAAVGRVRISSENPLFAEPTAVVMVVDILTERGFLPTAWSDHRDVPLRVETNGAIVIRRQTVYRFDIRFRAAKIRRGQ